MGKVCAITGAGGYLGSGLIRSLANDREWNRIIGIDITPPAAPPPDFEFHRRDIRDPELGKYLRSKGVSSLVHLAFVVNPMHDREEMRNINVKGTMNVLEAARTASVEHLVVTSSTTAYGARSDNPEWLTEESPLRGNPGYQYAAEKAEIDSMCQRFAVRNPGITVTVLRPCIVFGPHVDNFISRMIDLPLMPVIDGKNPRMQLVHEDDVTRCLTLALQKKRGGAYNLVGQGLLRWRELIRNSGRRPVPLPGFFLFRFVDFAWRMRWPRIEAPSPILAFLMYPWVASGEKASRELDFHPRYSAQETLKIFLNTRAAR